MKKRNCLLIGVLLILIIINLVSASYECSDNSQIETDQGEINIEDKKSINRLGVGLIKSDETSVFNRFSAELIADAGKFTITDIINSTEVELKKGTYTVTLLNLTNNIAKIKINSNSGTVEKGYAETVNSMIVYLSDTDGTYPGTATVNGMVGVEKVSLTNDAPAKVVSVNDVDYLLELYSASDTNAIIGVKTCKSGDLIKIEDPVEVIENPPEINETDTNITDNETDTNTTEIDNETSDETNTTLISEDENQDSESDKSKIPYNILIVIIVVCIVIIALFVLYILRKYYSSAPQEL